MKFTLLTVATLASSAVAVPTLGLLGSIFNSGKTVPGYPSSWAQCLNDNQAQFIVQTFKSILTNPDRTAAGKTAAALLSDSYTETSDSINVLDNRPQGATTFNGKQDFINNVVAAPAVSVMNDLDIFHDCNKIGWQWLVDGLALDVSPVKGFNKFVVDVKTGIVKYNDIEFNSIAWGRDLGWTCTAPPPRQ